MIKEIIVVEGRDDTSAIKRAVEADIIETHGYGISSLTIELLKKAYESRGLIIFTDPDYAGELIRKRLVSLFPKSKHAYLMQDEATKKGNIGIENASPENILKALSKVQSICEDNREFLKEDMIK